MLGEMGALLPVGSAGGRAMKVKSGEVVYDDYRTNSWSF
jgi:hypothetical protein